ncbi:hypothetical protein PFICI_11972 [Pestalotiopsis fici W106-1]|uniref:Ent-kaurene synthase n=1 Tax=Pestalotiopsis fici (strain W106-1 / CGMCC3.15140) TaxID=1229662 RepID=W3WRU4_PESFW|nr:uncharacterized protein PFICI_11972 [Pestalotiopsis fici W106-1]ETS76585.1 hypothetical protein PFICI_11972 [Pestalotiopsis fici W106-1]
MDLPSAWRRQGQELLEKLTAQCNGKGAGSMSSAIYDTAWLSMLRRPVDSTSGATQLGDWLFPECFSFLVTQQLPTGGWESYATHVDGILNTAAALLSILKHLQTQPDNHDWRIRSQNATRALEQMLGEWDIHSTDQVGQEILVISLLQLLEKEGVLVAFPLFGELRTIRDAKLAKLPASSVYKNRSTLYHSLEAFIGHIDFDRVKDRRETNGSLMNSPAATAAYLMNATSWDVQSEAYLRDVVDRDGGIHCGGVPCAWPTTIFEISWVVPVLAEVGVQPTEQDSAGIAKVLMDALSQYNGVLGFAAGILPDVDDTAKGIETLELLGHGGSTSIEPLIHAFEGEQHFLTYKGERTPSVSANCNVLSLLLLREDRAQYVPQIAKAASFAINLAYNGHVKEKWHRSELYWIMLLARAFALFYDHEDIIEAVFEMHPNLREQVPMVLIQILMRILHDQQANGSWSECCEITAYGILTLSSLVKLPFVRQLHKGNLIASMAIGKSYLVSNRQSWSKSRFMWIEKVTYGSNTLSEAYCLAASLTPMPAVIEPEPSSAISSWSEANGLLIPEKQLLGMMKTGDLLARTPLFLGTTPSSLRMAEMQACFAMQALQRRPLDIFPRTAKGKDKYAFIIPLALTLCAQSRGCSVSVSTLYEMMVLSILNFHVDEYMEGVVERHFGEVLDDVRTLVVQIVDVYHDSDGERDLTLTEASKEESNALQNGGHKQIGGTSGHDEVNGSERKPSLGDVGAVLSRYLDHILNHTAVLSASSRHQQRLATDLKTFLLAHITQAEDNCRFRGQFATQSGVSNGSNGTHVVESIPRQYHKPGRSFYNWVRGTSADHTSCPFSFVFFECLVLATKYDGGKTRPAGTLASARTAYLAEDACRHLATLCRMYNDYGSMVRDSEEISLNSVCFPEFSDLATGQTHTSETAKSELLLIAGYERHGLGVALNELEKELGSGNLMTSLRMFVDVTDLYGQIYVLKDVGTRTQ